MNPKQKQSKTYQVGCVDVNGRSILIIPVIQPTNEKVDITGLTPKQAFMSITVDYLPTHVAYKLFLALSEAGLLK